MARHFYTALRLFNASANFPANTSGADMYEVSIWCEPNDTKLQYRIERLNTGNVATGTISSDMSTNTSFLTPHVWINSGTTAGIVIDVVQTYLETMVP